MNKRERAFVTTVWQHYRQAGRHDLPWRKTTNPYRILVSEIMLQQTQVDRVLPKYRAFLRQWPTARRLAAAPLSDVLRAWQGLGYNRRAKFLRQAAKVVTNELGGNWPKTETTLLSLPGVGPYTAGAVSAFAYDLPVVLIETNIRQVYLHHFFKNKTAVSDEAILKLVKKTLPEGNAREWYWALMDYGAHLKQQQGNLTHRSKHYTKQSRFAGSDRQIRGAILRVLGEEGALTVRSLAEHLASFEKERVVTQLARLQTEGLVKQFRRRYELG